MQTITVSSGRYHDVQARITRLDDGQTFQGLYPMIEFRDKRGVPVLWVEHSADFGELLRADEFKVELIGDATDAA